jgi:TPP-dependent pyruvate/acetoin dehydrogenase alpha subunit
MEQLRDLKSDISTVSSSQEKMDNISAISAELETDIIAVEDKISAMQEHLKKDLQDEISAIKEDPRAEISDLRSGRQTRQTAEGRGVYG